MNKRLQTIAEMISGYSLVYDVGCDHALLSIQLVQSRRAQAVINFDLRAQPLAAGLKNVVAAGLTEQIQFVQNDGLKNYKPATLPDLVIISGLGVKTISKIIDETPFRVSEWIIQSNNFPEVIRRKMTLANYKIINEALVLENGIYYEIIHFCYQNQPVLYSEREIFFGPILLQQPAKLSARFETELLQWKKILQFRNDPQLAQQIKWVTELKEH